MFSSQVFASSQGAEATMMVFFYLPVKFCEWFAPSNPARQRKLLDCSY
jgi:hypothetical protein